MRDFIILAIIIQFIYFYLRGYKKVEWGKMPRTQRRYASSNLPFKEAWNTKYHWGTIFQIVLFLMLAFIGRK